MKRNAKQKQRQITQKQKTKNKMQFQSTRAARTFLWVGINRAANYWQPASYPTPLPYSPLSLPAQLSLAGHPLFAVWCCCCQCGCCFCRVASHLIMSFFSHTHNLLLLLLLLLALQFVAGRCALLRKSVSKMLYQQQHEFKKLSV